jgi:hypothetical protein
MVHPAYLEEATWKAGFAIGGGVKGSPVNRFEDLRSPAVEALQMLAL